MRNYAVIIVLILLLPSFDIVRRHDISDEKYIELGKAFDAVSKVGIKGGDGTLVAPDWVVTAAHVAEGVMKADGTVELFFDGDLKRTSKNVFIHPGFDGPNGHDIALIQLNEPVTSIKPLSFYKEKDEKDQMIYIVGHGDYKHGNSTEWKQDGQRRAATNIIDEVRPLFILFDFDEPDSGATELEGTAGPGDSGGPAIIRVDGIDYIAGISSGGMPGEKGPGTYGAREFYTRVSTKMDWIDQVISGQIKPAAEKSQVRRSAGMPDGFFEGLGLILKEENDAVAIMGKVDPEVPQEFRAVRFEPVSKVIRFNEESVVSIKALRTAFDNVSPGESYTITFEIKGIEKTFKSRK